MTDAIDLHSAVVHASPSDIADWPATTRIERLMMKPGQDAGLSFKFSGNQTWPDYVPPGWEGPIQYTVWAGVQVEGKWHVGGFIQMWRTRPSTGAPILAHWREWAYDKSRWGAMVDYQPKPGDQMIFFLSAGNARRGSAGAEGNVTSVRERSNVVIVALPAGDDGEFLFDAASAPVGAPTPVVTPTPTVDVPAGAAIATRADVEIAIAELRSLGEKVQALTDAVKALQAGTS